MKHSNIKAMKAKQYKKFSVNKFGDPDETRYDIIRMYHPSQERRSRRIKTNISGDEAHAHVNNPKTSVAGKYFDGFEKH